MNGAERYLDIAAVTKQFGSAVVLKDLDLAVGRHEFVSLLGPSGCGKTTLLRLIAGLLKAESGRISIGGNDLTRVAAHKRNIGVVFQNYALFPHLTVEQNVAFGLEAQRRPKPEIAERVANALALVRMQEFADRRVTVLSGGQQQRIAVARAIVVKPTLLLLDEPFSALDRKLRETMQIEMRHLLRDLGITSIFVTHDQDEALVMSDRIAVMNEGRIEQLGSPRDIYTRPTSVFASDFIGDTNLIRGTIVATDGKRAELATRSGTTVAGVASETLATGAAATLSVRPGSVRVTRAAGDPSTDGAIGMPASIVELIYLGDRIRVEADAGDGLVVIADLREEEAEGFERMMPVRLAWAPTAASVWPDGPDDTRQEVR